MSDQVKNFAYSTTTASVTAVATSFSVQSGHGARFPATSGGAYNLVVYNPIYPNASVAYQNSSAEIIRVTTRSTDTFSVITRAQEGTSAIAWGADWRVEMNVTAKNFEDASATVSGLVTTSAQSFAGAKTFRDNILAGVASTTTGQITLFNASDSNEVRILADAGGYTGTRQITLPDVTGTFVVGSAVNTVSPTSPNRTITINIGGTLYYLHAKTTND
jgi:hypothetical protein